jgi:hypothetical protein
MISDEREVAAQLDTAGDPPLSSQARRIAAAVSSSRTNMSGAWDTRSNGKSWRRPGAVAEPPMVPDGSERLGSSRDRLQSGSAYCRPKSADRILRVAIQGSDRRHRPHLLSDSARPQPDLFNALPSSVARCAVIMPTAAEVCRLKLLLLARKDICHAHIRRTRQLDGTRGAHGT